MNHNGTVAVHRNEFEQRRVIAAHNCNARRLEEDFMNMLRQSEWPAGTGSGLICILLMANSLI